MQRVLLVAFASAAVALGLMPRTGSAQPPIPPRITVAAWNIEWLGKPHNRSGAGKDVAQSAQDIADYIKASAVDILSVEEVTFDTGTDDNRQNKTLVDACKFLNRLPGQQWEHRLFPKRDEDAKDQCVGLIWNESRVQPQKTQGNKPFYRLEMTAPQNLTDDPDFGAGSHYFDRWATAMKFSAGKDKTDVVLIPVHLKANIGGVAKTRRQRNVEAKMLTKALAKVRDAFRDDDIIILGDTNILKNDEPATTTITHAGFNDLNFLDAATHQGGAPFDRAFVADDTNPKGRNKEFAHSAQEVFAHPDFNSQQFKKRLSDHYLIRFSIDVMDDDD
ncbi:Extracellular nuclease, putative OS=Blastopirellula marina DSM 3645 GN=DSM3645_12526 PE=4 SV=1: Exo_endo_phos [Gemmata massiliana]|uniref:Endonuclease/exonuclease/phosphatase domain-containing protein n=1 Tax=Gemmata massiliana TaxID=1210884 RepID=A0A6P2CXT7_9BACT|nr:endonuclease/exonuclease/phosphatase family protein [Gemmata massiliana]VTR93347.1 Extracellular nuclease, putative OS=Blastopirellula marina DSM 3645 GN=DSM3645_12526 PE=4 SV=1: Exo_endo_phos [Gemmata massiliana]